MPVTKRMAVHSQGGKGMTNCYNYITNKDKTEEGHLVSSQNCSVNFALMEFEENTRKFGKEKDDRVGYHIVQSFDPHDSITPELANQIGLELCQAIYPDYQCVVSTHVDKGHIHNHILLNAVSLNGRKLNDRLADPKEGLMALRIYSDQVAAKYGCKILDEKPIGKYRSKDYEHRPSRSESSKITHLIDELKEEVNSMTELLERLSLEGYQIKRGKYLAVKGPDMERYRRLAKLGEDYSEEALRRFFQLKTYNGVPENFRIPNFNSTSVYQQQSKESLQNEYTGIQYASKQLHSDGSYPMFYNSRYKAQKELSRLSKLFVQMNELEIFEAGDLTQRIDETLAALNTEQDSYSNLKDQVIRFGNLEQAANDFLKTYEVWKKWDDLKTSSNAAMEIPDLVADHLEASKILGVENPDEVKELLNTIKTLKRKANQSLARISFLKSRMTDLERMRGLVMENEGFIKRLSFSERMIDQSRSSDDNMCVRIPYTKEYLYIHKDQVVWSRYSERANFYLVDDQKYQLVDRDDNPTKIISGDQLDQISKDSHDRIKEYYEFQK